MPRKGKMDSSLVEPCVWLPQCAIPDLLTYNVALVVIFLYLWLKNCGDDELVFDRFILVT